MKRFVVVFLTIVMVFSVVAFADEPEETPAESVSSDPVSILKNQVEVFKAADNAIRATTYTITDLYNLTYDIFFNTAGSTPVNEIVTIRQRVNTINTGVITANGNLQKLIDILNPDYDTVGIDFYTMLKSYFELITDIDPNDNNLSMYEILLYTYSEVEDANSSLNSIISNLATIESDVDGVEGHLQLANSKLSSIYNTALNLKTDTGHIYADVDSILDIQHMIENYIEDLHDVYASDDYLEAKEDQQDYEDAAIEDFTGSGSAAATGQDLGNLKDVSTTIKSGLQSGGSVSNGLSAFRTNSGFWEWFSQGNSNQINQPSSGAQPTRGVPDFYSQYDTRSSNTPPDVIDFYDSNRNQLLDLFEDNK